MTFMFSPKNHPFWTCRCFSTGWFNQLGQNDTQIKSKRDSHQSCFWCEALLANLRNVQKDGTRFFNLLFGGHRFHRQFRTGALWNDTGLQPHQCQTLRVTRKVAGNAESCRSIWVPWYQKSEEKTLIVHSTTSWIMETSTLDLPVSVGTWLAGCDSEVLFLWGKKIWNWWVCPILLKIRFVLFVSDSIGFIPHFSAPDLARSFRWWYPRTTKLDLEAEFWSSLVCP